MEYVVEMCERSSIEVSDQLLLFRDGVPSDQEVNTVEHDFTFKLQDLTCCRCHRRGRLEV